MIRDDRCRACPGLALDARVELFEFDLAIHGGTVYRYVNDVKPGGIYFDGQLYSPLPLEI